MALRICSEGYDEIVFESKFCPCCNLNDQLDDLNDDLDKLRDDIEDNEAKIDELEDELKLFKFKDGEPPEINEDAPRKER